MLHDDPFDLPGIGLYRFPSGSGNRAHIQAGQEGAGTKEFPSEIAKYSGGLGIKSGDTVGPCPPRKFA